MVERVVYVLGAGASHDAGGPLVRDFFTRKARFDNRVYPKHLDDNQRYQALDSIFTDWSHRSGTSNVESFFQTIITNEVTGKKFEDTRTGNEYDASTIRRYLVWYIASYVKHCISAQRNPPKHYADFVELLFKRGTRSSVLTFNYDLVIENSILRNGGTVDYKLGRIWGLSKYSSRWGIPVIKLHGSLNWLVCPKCDEVFVSDEPVAHKYSRESCTVRCGGMREPFIVPPSPSKEQYLGAGNELWRAARKSLEQADRIVIIGYSLPDLDYAARELLRASIQGGKKVLEVVNSSQTSLKHVVEGLGLEYLDAQNMPTDYTPVASTFRDYVMAKTGEM